MRGGQERLSPETQRLFRYLDREMTRDEEDAFCARLADDPCLRQQLDEMQRVGAMVRLWSSAAEARAGELVEPTLSRVSEAAQRRGRRANVGYALAAVLLIALPWSRRVPLLLGPVSQSLAVPPSAAAIERVEAADQQAQVFVLGTSRTPVVWLADDASDDETTEQQGPG
jgi:hypothetical protein